MDSSFDDRFHVLVPFTLPRFPVSIWISGLIGGVLAGTLCQYVEADLWVMVQPCFSFLTIIHPRVDSDEFAVACISLPIFVDAHSSSRL